MQPLFLGDSLIPIQSEVWLMSACIRILVIFIAAAMVFFAEKHSFATINGGGSLDDNQQSFVYYAETGEFAFDQGFALMAWDQLSLSSASGVFDFHENAHPVFTTRSDTVLSTPIGQSIPSFSIGLVAQPGLSEAFLLTDLTGYAGCGLACDPAAPDFVYIPRIVPEPAAFVLAAATFLLLPLQRRRVTGAR